MSERQVDWWDWNVNAERLHCKTQDEAFLEWWDETDGPVPEMLTIYGFSRMAVDEPDAQMILERVLVDLDVEYGDPEGDGTVATPKMIEAAKAFVRVVSDEYQRTSFACEQTSEVTVNVADTAARLGLRRAEGG